MLITAFPEAEPVNGLLGGLLIGLAAAIMLIGLGRIAGVSGLFARMFALGNGGGSWPVASLFTAGLVLGALLFIAVYGPVQANFPPSYGWLVAGGLLVGIGTRMGSGCTSGHGVCGISRLSRRSLAATATFMATGMATVAFVNAMGGGW
jgi:uncharacterized membrane protein YedE/YeeE